MPLTDRQRNLLAIINQLSQNTTNILQRDIAVDLPTVGLDLDLGGITRSGTGTTPPTETPATPPATAPTTPETIGELLSTLVNEQVEVTTPFGVVSGLLLAVRDDYITIVEDGSQVFVRMDKIELLGEL